MLDTVTDFLRNTILVPLVDLHDHVRNYLTHPDDQIDHLCVSIEAHGVYRPIVAARWEGQYTILAGHGLKVALLRLGHTTAQVYPLDIDPLGPQALLLLAGDNGIPHRAIQNDAALAALLRDVQAIDPDGLLGTGYDDAGLAALLAGVGQEAWADALGTLPTGDKAPFEQMTFTLHTDQVAIVREALARAKGGGVFVDTGNENSNGNALARICEAYHG